MLPFFTLVKSFLKLVAIFFWIPSIPLFFVGCYHIIPDMFMPLVNSNEFTVGRLSVDTVVYSDNNDNVEPTIYSIGHIGENGKVYELQIDRGELHPSYASKGEIISVYYHPQYKRVYFHKEREPAWPMPVSKTLVPFLFWSSITILPLPLFTYIFLRHRRSVKKEKERIASNPREKWIRE